MRLFIAINFTQDVKNGLCKAIQLLQKYSIQGNFTRPENLHLTLTFIGETQNVDNVKRVMDTVQIKPFTLCINEIGKFRRNQGDIYWMGIQKSNELLCVYYELFDSLSAAGFRLEKREYKPHVTLGRKVIVRDDFDSKSLEKALPEMTMMVDSIHLMKSERVNGRLVYTDIHR